jgi:hypothetical protein
MKPAGLRASRLVAVLLGLTACAVLLTAPGALATHGGDREVTVGFPGNDSFFSRNKQNEPAIAVDQNLAANANPTDDVLASGANDNIDNELCNPGDDTTCPFTPNVGGSGITFSFDRGDSWIQPTYTGWSARHCLGVPGDSDPDCVAQQGPIGTLPRYDERNLVSDGDPALAFGPRPGAGGFSWANGSRLYYANLTSNVTADLGEPSFKGFEAIAVSRTDNPQSAAAGNEAVWRQPVIVSKQSSATFADKEQIWADNAASSRFFGHVYVCFARFQGAGAAPMFVSVSRDGGDTWATRQVSPAHNIAAKHFGQSGCTIRTDSQGVVYLFYEEFQDPLNPSVGFPPPATHMLVQSFDGGRTWTRPRALYRVVDPCFVIDPVIGRCVMDGIAGARSDLAAAPSVDIANGAPTGADATDLIVVSWADGREGLNNEDVMVSWSTNRGRTFSGPTRVSSPGSDRGYYAAPAVSPDGTDVYIVYNAFNAPFQNTTASPRPLVGVVKHIESADLLNGGSLTVTELHRGAQGDARSSAQNNLEAEFLGDYVYAIATRDYAAAVWNDARQGADCPAIDAWRMSLRTETTADDVPTPRPNIDCPATFGNTDIFGWSGLDPSP